MTSYGYDAKVGYKFKVFTNTFSTVVDPKNFHPSSFVDIDLTPRAHDVKKHFKSNRHPIQWICNACGDVIYERQPGEPPLKDVPEFPCPAINEHLPNYVIIPTNSFALAETVETFEIPRDTLAICIGKSTYARCGIIVNVTPLEPEWRGKVTVEISNTTPLPVKVYVNEGIMQVFFLRSDDPLGCEVSYNDRKGKYQDQTGLVLPIISKGDDEDAGD